MFSKWQYYSNICCKYVCHVLDSPCIQYPYKIERLKEGGSVGGEGVIRDKREIKQKLVNKLNRNKKVDLGFISFEDGFLFLLLKSSWKVFPFSFK